MKLGFLSLGCPKNLVDGEVMLGLAREAGHEITPDASSADVIVVNTCAFIDTAKEESIDAILEMAELKRQGSCKRLVVTGCLAERYRDQLRAEIPEIDVVLGTNEVPEITRAIDGTPAAAAPVTLFRSREALTGYAEPRNLERRNQNLGTRTAEPRNPNDYRNVGTPEPRDPRTSEPRDREGPAPTYLYDSSTPRLLTTPRHYAYVKVAEGCDYSCAFCIIPTLRGHYRSRDEASIVAEATRLAARGVRELLLISQDTTFFGIDRG
ncbi:MAG TPA: hypothetical protein VF424_13655, partial [Vicinamibacterales bacterium]